MPREQKTRSRWQIVGQNIFLTAVLLMALPHWIAAAEAATYTVNSNADSFLNQDNTAQNNGNVSQLDLTSRRVPIYGFALPAIAPGETIVSASLKLWVTNPDTKLSSVHRVTDTWTETTVTWANTGADFDATAEATFTPSTISAYVTIDITSLVGAWYGGSTANNGVMVRTSAGAGDAKFSAREFGTATQRPELVVTTTTLPPVITIVKSSVPMSDPMNGATNPKAIPGAVLSYTAQASNSANGSADNNSTIITDAVPTTMQLYVGDLGGAGSGPISFTNGSPSSGLTYTYTSLASGTDSLSFSNNGGSTYAYTPVPDADGYDAAVTHVRVNPAGSFAPKTGATDPSFTIQTRMRVK